MTGIVFALAAVACADRDQRQVNFVCEGSPATYRTRTIASEEVLRAVESHPLDVKLPDDILGFDEYTFGPLHSPHVGFVLVFGNSHELGELVWVIVSDADLPACSGPPEEEPVSRSPAGVAVYPYQFSRSVQYAAWFRPADRLAVQLAVTWLPDQEPPLEEQLDSVTHWIDVMTSLGEAR